MDGERKLSVTEEGIDHVGIRIYTDFTTEEIVRMCNIFSRRLLATGLEFYGSRDQKILAKIQDLLIRDERFGKTFQEQDRGLGSFDKQRRDHWVEKVDQS